MPILTASGLAIVDVDCLDEIEDLWQYHCVAQSDEGGGEVVGGRLDNHAKLDEWVEGDYGGEHLELLETWTSELEKPMQLFESKE